MFRLLDKKVDEDSYFLNENGTKDYTKKMDFTNFYAIQNPFWVIDTAEGPNKGGRKHFRYIAGCAFFDIERQDKEKYVYDSVSGVIGFKAGGDIICDDETNDPLIRFLKIHPNNVKSEYHNKDKHDAVFFTYDPKEEVKKEAEVASAEDEAMAIVIGLKDDKDRLKAVATLFEETRGLTDENEMYLGLRRVAKENPAIFTQSIASKEQSVLGDVMLALKYAIINRNAKGFYFEGMDGTIFEPAGKSEKEAAAELVKFLMSKEGAEFYKQLIIKKQQKDIELAAPKEN